MAALLQYPLNLDTGTDFSASWTWGLAQNELTSFVGATAQLMIRETPADLTPLLSISTTPNASGGVYLGQAPPGPFGATVTTLAALVAYNPSALAAGTLVYVQTPASYYSWTPGGSQVPDGVTIIDGIGGQWLLTATIVVKIANAAMATLVGTVQASYDLLVTWADGTITKFLEGPVYVDQTSTHD
jgi:hypothetical protein